ncbi:GNAT family N-acetyltransferase [Pontibacter sp. G13]|uniref:GNAT family N-acetyltransferase n=1 Tax=Pontibacter sp. G13 TaxID=3074898 RepID=UPI002889D388|nr:GNAT family N-acetyltransferase [Pontibacter sp. G13]WNJ19304.1 GNAT family N-acetyltransferase [Pontibacter sp. G13]
MSHSAFPQLNTQRLILRDTLATDWQAISHLRSDSTINQFIKRPSAHTQAEAMAFIHKVQKGFREQSITYWAITQKPAEEMIGSICLWNFSADRKQAEVGYDLMTAAQGKGIMSEALAEILRYGFQTLQLEVIEAYTQFQNTPSRKMLERHGFVLATGSRDASNPDNVIYKRSSI